MVKFFYRHKIIFFVIFALISFLAGGINGFLGTGGGIAFVYALSLTTDNEQKDTFATTLCATVPISAIALFGYAKEGQVDFELMGKIWLPCIVGGLLGAFLVDRLRLEWLKGIFAALVIYSGACMIFK